jgi:hypothetical protein
MRALLLSSLVVVFGAPLSSAAEKPVASAGAPSAQPPPPPLLFNEPPPVYPSLSAPNLEAHVDLWNLFLFRNDSDFDPSRAIYNVSGPTVGAFATVLRPWVTWHITKSLRVFYQVELGLNFWSKQNPDQQNPVASDIFVMKHRELWAEGTFSENRFGFKAGYGFFRDTTALFLGHWIGAAQAWWAPAPGSRLGLFVGQIPDPTHEGIQVSDNNFQRDIFVFGISGFHAFSDRWRLSFGLHNLIDTHLVDQRRWIAAPNFHLEYASSSAVAWLDFVLQAGEQEGTHLGGGSETLLSWAAQGHLEWKLSPRLELAGNLLLLSPDDASPGNGWDHSFRYSGKSRSATLMLTEDEIRDWYDNLDERLSRSDSGFFKGRAGLMVADLKLTWSITERFRPAFVVGAATVLKPDNAGGHAFVGFEADLILEYRYSQHLSALLAAGLLVPGRAGALLLNRVEPTQTQPMSMVEASLLVRY